MSEHQKYAVKLYEDIAAAREKFRKESFEFIENVLEAYPAGYKLRQVRPNISNITYTEIGKIKGQVIVGGYLKYNGCKTPLTKPLVLCSDEEIVELIKRM